MTVLRWFFLMYPKLELSQAQQQLVAQIWVQTEYEVINGLYTTESNAGNGND